MVNIESMDDRFLRAQQRHWHPNDEGSFYAYNGVIWNFSIPDFIRQMPAKSILDFNMVPEKRKEYMEKFIGAEEPSAAGRFYEELDRSAQADRAVL